MPWTKSLGLQFSHKSSIPSFERVNIQITIFYLRSHLCGCRNGMLEPQVLPRMNSASNTNALAFQRQISTFLVRFILKEPYCKQQCHSVCATASSMHWWHSGCIHEMPTSNERCQRSIHEFSSMATASRRLESDEWRARPWFPLCRSQGSECWGDLQDSWMTHWSSRPHGVDICSGPQ